MTFISGQKIQAADYNNLVTDLNNVYAIGTGDAGYGAASLPIVGTPPPFIAANLVDNQNWLDLRDAIIAMGNHQGSVPTLPDLTDLEDKNTQTGGSTQGDDIQAFASFTSAITTVTANRLNVGVGSTVVDNSVLSDSRTADWSTQIQHVFTIDFTTDDAARHFFNTGGQIRLTMSGPNDDAGHQWGGIYSTSGTFIFDHSHYYELSSTINNLVNVQSFDLGAGVYSFFTQANIWSLSARYLAGTSANGARGSKIEISSISTDIYAGNPSFPSSPDIVSGTFISTIGERRSVTFFNRPQPTYTTVISLADGT